MNKINIIPKLKYGLVDFDILTPHGTITYNAVAKFSIDKREMSFPYDSSCYHTRRLPPIDESHTIDITVSYHLGIYASYAERFHEMGQRIGVNITDFIDWGNNLTRMFIMPRVNVHNSRDSSYWEKLASKHPYGVYVLSEKGEWVVLKPENILVAPIKWTKEDIIEKYRHYNEGYE